MKGIVWGKTLDRANEKLAEIVEKYLQMRHKIIEQKNTKHHTAILFDNGDYWQAIRASDNARGHKCNVSYIDHELEKYITIIDIIEHCTTAMPYHGINYF